MRGADMARAVRRAVVPMHDQRGRVAALIGQGDDAERCVRAGAGFEVAALADARLAGMATLRDLELVGARGRHGREDQTFEHETAAFAHDANIARGAL